MQSLNQFDEDDSFKPEEFSLSLSPVYIDFGLVFILMFVKTLVSTAKRSPMRIKILENE